MRAFWIVLACLWSLPALAGVTRIPGPALTADGLATGNVLILVDPPDAKLKIKSDTGKVGLVESMGAGVYRFAFTPPALSASQDVNVRISLNGTESSLAVPVLPPVQGSLDLSFEPAVLPATGTAMVRIRATGSSPLPADARRFSVVASSGTIDSPISAGDGTWIAKYTPAKGLTEPTLATLSVVDLAFPEQIWGEATLAITVKRSVSFTVQANSSNVLTIGDRSYGPLTASPQGQVAFDVELNPLIPNARLQSVNPDTSKLDEQRPLPVKIAPQILILPLSPSIPGKTELPVRVLVVDPAKTLPEGTIPTLTTSKGTLGSLSAQTIRASNGERLYLATLQAPETTGEIVINGTFGTAKAERRIKVLSGLPVLALNATPNALDPKTTSLSLTALLKDATGTALPNLVPVLSAEGATASGTVKNNKDGTYTLLFKRTATAGDVRFYGVPALEVSAGAPAQIIAWTSNPGVRSGGNTILTVVVVDRWGLPVPNVALKPGVPMGDGNLPPSATTNAQGLARLTYTAGSGSGPVGLRVDAAGLRMEMALWQSADGSGELPAQGDEALRQLISRYKAACPLLVVSTPAPAPAVAATPTPATPVATPVAAVPSAQGTPVATATATPGPSPTANATATRPPKPEAADTGIARFRSSLALSNLHGSYSQETNAAERLLGEVESASPALGFWGIQGDLRWWAVDASWGRLGPELHVGSSLELLSVLDSTKSHLSPEVAVGARYAYPLGIFSVEGGLDFLYTTYTLMRYTDDTLSEVDVVRLGKMGARLDAGVAVEKGPVHVSLDIAEAFVPFPGVTQAALGVDYTISDPLFIHVYGVYDLHNATFEAGETGDGSIHQKRMGAGVGVGTLF